MAGTDELLARLTQLENGYYGDKKAAREKQFFDTYGARFSNNRGLGLAILNELDARGIDTSAADEAVQQILDTLRTECNEIIESIKDTQQQAIDTAQKVEEISNVVAEAVASNPNADNPGEAIPPAIEPAEVPPALDAMNPDGEFNPEETPPAEEQAGEEPPAEEPAPAEEVPPAPEEQTPPEEETVSDARMKKIRGVLSDVRMKRIKSTSNFKPSAGIIAAASRGY